LRADDEWRIPVPAHAATFARSLAALTARTDGDRLATGVLVHADDGPVLRHGVNDLGIIRIDARLHAVAAAVLAPVAGADAVREHRALRAAAGACCRHAA